MPGVGAPFAPPPLHATDRKGKEKKRQNVTKMESEWEVISFTLLVF